LLQLQPEWQRFVTLVKQSQVLKHVSYQKLYDILKQHQHEVNGIRAEKIARVANPLALDNSPQIHRNAGYEGQRSGTVSGARETVGTSMVQKYRIQCYNCKEYGHVARECQKSKRAKDAAYHREKMLLYVDDSGPIFDKEPEQKVQNNDRYDVFAIDCQHPEQSESVHNTYLLEQDAQNVSIESMDMNYDSEQIDQHDEDVNLAKE
nr:hypothetical protein [Tanacetum cinerariifolium]